MERLSQEYMLRITFSESVEREELLIKKYDHHCPAVKDSEVKEYIREFKGTSREHIDLLKDKMLKLNFEK